MRDRLAKAHSLIPLELAQGAVEGAFQSGQVSQQLVEPRRVRHAAVK